MLCPITAGGVSYLNERNGGWYWARVAESISKVLREEVGGCWMIHALCCWRPNENLK